MNKDDENAAQIKKKDAPECSVALERNDGEEIVGAMAKMQAYSDFAIQKATPAPAGSERLRAHPIHSSTSASAAGTAWIRIIRALTE